MVDYLEELWAHADALLDQLRRMERGLSGAPEGGQETAVSSEEPEGLSKTRSPACDLLRRAHPLEDMAGSLNAAKNGWAGPEDTAANPTAKSEENLPSPKRPGGDPAGGEKPREPFPLAVQLDRLERAVSASSGGARSPGKTEGRRMETSAPAGYRSAGTHSQGAESLGEDWSGPEVQLPSGGSTDWVEQADRAFRRDSRRYDGGFYLY